MAKRYNYDSESDSLYIFLKEGKEEDYEEIIPGINAELDSDGNIIGVEVLKASRFMKDLKDKKTST